MFTSKNLFKLAGKHILVVLVVIFFSSITILLVSKQITQMSAKAVENRQMEATLIERASTLSELKKESEIIGSNGTIIKHAFIPSNNILEFVTILESLAQKNGLTQSFRFTPPTIAIEDDNFSVTTISYQNTITSNVSTFSIYLKEFENLPYFTRIDSLSISSSEGDWRKGGTASWSASLLAEAME